MSSQLTTLVQTFDGSNYQLWSKTMKAWLTISRPLGFVDRTIVRPVDQLLVLLLRKLPLQKLQLLLGSGVTIWLWAILSYALILLSKKASELSLQQRLFGTIFAIVMVLQPSTSVQGFLKKRLTFVSILTHTPLCS